MNWIKRFLNPPQTNFQELLIKQGEFAIASVEAMHDYDKLIEAVKKFTIDFQPDAFSDTFRIMAWARTLEILDY